VRKRLVIGLLLVAVFVSVAHFLVTDRLSAAKPVVVNIGYENNPGEPLDLACKEWQRLVEERSNGTIKIQLFPSSQLGTKKDATEQMLMGANVVHITDPSFLMDYVPDMGILSAPYIVETYDQLFELFETDWYKGLKKELEAKGLTIVADNWIYGDRHLLATRPARKPEDLKGLKIRIPNNRLSIEMMEAMGATATPMPLGEVYPALAQGVIGGAENPLSVLYGAKLQEEAKYLSLTEHQKMVIFWLGSAQFFNSLPKEQADLIRKAGMDAGLAMKEINEKNDQKLMENFKKEGVQIITDVDKEAFRENCKAIYDKFPQWSEGLYDKIQNLIK